MAGFRRRPEPSPTDKSGGAVATLESPAPAAASPARSEGSGPRRLGDVLTAEFGVSQQDLQRALDIQQDSGEALGAILIDLGVITDNRLVDALASQFGLERIDLKHVLPTGPALDLVGADAAREFHILPLSVDEGVVTVATGDPSGTLVQRLSAKIGAPVKVRIASRREIETGLAANYRALAGLGAQVASFEADLRALPQVVDIFDADEGDAPIVQAVDLLLTQAARDRASDVHIEMGEDIMRVRFRVDGALTDVASLPARMAGPIASRIKIMAGMNIVEKRRPQDGQFAKTIDGRDLDVRVASCGTVLGEKVIMRLLDKSKPALHLSDLGMSPDAFERFTNAIRSPHGMVVCAGPTGSGKTTSLYASLRDIDSRARSVVTIEDPVEYVFPEISQIQVNESAGLTFANGLRSILRQDPDVILVGEVRDEETARIAVQSSLTGHLVLSSLHGTDAVAALFRFFDMGIESYLVASSVIAVIGQRLLRRVCRDCQTDYSPTPEEWAFWVHAQGSSDTKFITGQGCNFCHGTGYVERIGIYEILEISPEIAEAISVGRPSRGAIRDLARAQGMTTLRDEARHLVETQVTSISEAMRAIHLL